MKAHTKGTTGNTMMQKSFLWVPCSACQWSCQMGLLPRQNTKQQSNLHTQRSMGIQTGCLGGPAWGTEPSSSQQVWCVGIQVKLILD